MRRRLRWVCFAAVLGVTALVFGLLEGYRAKRLEVEIEGARRTLVLSRQVGEASALRRQLASQTASRRSLATHALAARAGVEVFERAHEESVAAAKIEVVSRTPWVGIEALVGKVGPHAAAFGSWLTVRAGLPSLVRVARSWEGWPDRARLRSIEVRPAGPAQVEAVLELAVVRVLPGAPLLRPKALGLGRPLLPQEDVRDPFARAFARARLKDLRVTVQGVATGRDPRALISGRVLRVGDRLDVFTIDAIDREGVVLRGPGGLRARLRRAVAPKRSQGRRPPPAGSPGPR